MFALHQCCKFGKIRTSSLSDTVLTKFQYIITDVNICSTNHTAMQTIGHSSIDITAVV